MKNIYIKNILFLMVIIVSISCAVYVNSPSKSTSLNALPLSEEMIEIDEMEEEKSTTLPDIQVIKNIIESGKRLLPLGS